MSDFTVSDVAKRFKRSRDRITTLIKTGKLEAYDAAPDGQYRQWRVTPEALEAFILQNGPKPRKTQKTRRHASSGVKEFF